MLTKNYFKSEQTVEEWVECIEANFHDIDFENRTTQVVKMLSVSDGGEMNKIEKASCIVYGKKIGITSFEDACDILGVNYDLPDVTKLWYHYGESIIVQYKLMVICDAINMVDNNNKLWSPDWSDDQKRYTPRFESTPSGFVYDGYDCWDTYTGVGTFLCFKEMLSCYYFSKMFILEYNKLMLK